MWTVEKLLDMIQELLGEPAGGFYNISQRLAHLSQAQNELVDETSAIKHEGSIDVQATIPEYELPEDFGRFGDRKPTLDDMGLDVVPPIHLDSLYTNWRYGGHKGTPKYIVQEGASVFLYPTPGKDGTLRFNYIPVLEPLVDFEQEPFNGRRDLNRYAPALAYKVAFLAMAPRAPQLAQMYEDMYIREEKKMRHYARTNAQDTPALYPSRLWGSNATRR